MALFWGFVNKGLNNPHVLWRQHVDFSEIILRHCDFSIFIYQKTINIALKCCERHVLWCRPFTKTTCFLRSVLCLWYISPATIKPGVTSSHERRNFWHIVAIVTCHRTFYVPVQTSRKCSVWRRYFTTRGSFIVESDNKVVIWGHSVDAVELGTADRECYLRVW